MERESYNSSIKYVSGNGNAKAYIVFIGEAPGETEERLGEPFAGRSGLILNKWIEYLGFKRHEVYVTNVVKVRPAGNRTPTEEEVKSWLTLLQSEISQINPKYTITLGKTAEQAIQFLGLNDTNTVLYHPAFVLRKPSAETTVLQRLDKLKELIVSKKEKV